MDKKTAVRLPAHIKPKRYQITIKPDLKGFVFEGEETIFLTIDKPSQEIVLYAKELKISKIEYKTASGKYKAKQIKYDKKAETATFIFGQILPKGAGELKLAFKGELNNKMRGFYRSRYLHQNQEKHLATTQFEPTDARRAFPSFDEPAQKAIFDVTLMIPKGTTAISNTIQTEAAEHESGYQIVKFAPTPKMSTYLLAFIVGEFEFVEGKTKNDVLVRVFTTPGKKHQAKFALECGIKSLEFYNEYFDIPYPLPVLDLIAIPDFEVAAMENWGAITYRESAILIDPEHSSAANKEWVAIVIAHEIAHQWFGDLVTMEWWTHLWLNEGFASYMEHMAVDHMFPEWGLWERFVTDRLFPAMRLDALASTHPIEVEVHHPSEIGEIFDSISYSKGASVIRMLAEYLGAKNFRDGLRYYLKKHAYGNAETKHLWAALEKVSGKPVRQMMKNWTGKPGFPMVKVLSTGKQLELVQSRFFSSELSQQQAKDKTVWQIPVNLVTDKSGKPKKVLMSDKEKNIAKPKGAKWIKFNAGQTSLFRTNYPPQMLEALATPILNKALEPADRIGILGDCFALAEAGQMPTTEVLKLAENYKHETDFNVISELAAGLNRIGNLIRGEKYYDQYRAFCRNIFSSIAKKTGWQKKKGESHAQGLLRSLALYQAGFYGDQEIITKAKEFFAKGSVAADLRGVVYSLAAENGGSREYEDLISRYKKESLYEEQERLGRALGHFNNVELLEKTIQFIMSENVRPQDKPFILAGVWFNDHGRELAWSFVKKNWQTFDQMYHGVSHMLERLIQPAGVFTDGEKAADIIKFFKTHKTAELARTVQQVVERVRSNAMWLSRDKEHIGNWLKDYE